MSEKIIFAQNLTKKFKNLTALDSINFELKKGNLTAVIGSDGTGKNTLRHLICGLMAPTSRILKVFGKNIVKNEQFIKNKISDLPQKFGLYQDLTVAENMNLYADLHGFEKNKKRLAGNLSVGMKKKLGLA